jgi:hypothetical protein
MVMNNIASSCSGFDINFWFYGTPCTTYCEQALGVFAVIFKRALPIDSNLVWLVAHRMPLCDKVDARFGSGAGWKWRCGFGLRRRRRGDGRLCGWNVIGGTQILESEERGQESDLQAFAVRDVEPVRSTDCGSHNMRERGKDVPIEIVM